VIKNIEAKALNIRKRILRMSFESKHTSHLGGSLSIVDILACLYFGGFGLDQDSSSSQTQNKFILSKGHAALAFFATLIEVGQIKKIKEHEYMKNGSELIAHPIRNVENGIESSNGSLGQGLSFAVGIATAFKLQSTNR